MNTICKHPLANSIFVAAIAAIGFAAPTASHALEVGGPGAGMTCRTGYTPAFNGTALTCSRASSFELLLGCANPNFPAYTIRFGTANNDDRDLCTRTAGAISINQSLQGLTESTNGSNGNYVYATFDPAELAVKTRTQDEAEAMALGLQPSGVETRTGTVVVKANGRAGGKGEGNVPVTYLTFAIPTSGGVGNTGPVSLPKTTNSTSAFVPRPLPR